MERLRESLGRFFKGERLPEQIEISIVVLGQTSKDGFEPGVYLETNISPQAWQKNSPQIQNEIASRLIKNEKIQKLLGEPEKVKIPLGEEISLDPSRAVTLTVVGLTGNGKGVVARLERFPIGEMVIAVNLPQVQEVLKEVSKEVKALTREKTRSQGS